MRNPNWSGLRQLCWLEKQIWYIYCELFSQKLCLTVIANDNTKIDPIKIADILNSSFTFIGRNLQNKIPSTKKTFPDYLNKPNSYNSWCPPCPKRWGNFNFEKFKSLVEEVFIRPIGGTDCDNDNQKEGGI